MEELKTTWVVLAAIVSGVTLVWKFVGTIKEIRKSINEPITKLDAKVTELKLFVEKNDKLQNETLQSILRDRLFQLHEECSKKGFASISEKDNWENMYKKYHALGQNGVMDATRDKMMALPTPPEYEASHKKEKKLLNE